MGIHYLCPTMPHKGDFVDLLDDVDETSGCSIPLTPSESMRTEAMERAWTEKAR